MLHFAPDHGQDSLLKLRYVLTSHCCLMLSVSLAIAVFNCWQSGKVSTVLCHLHCTHGFYMQKYMHLGPSPAPNQSEVSKPSYKISYLGTLAYFSISKYHILTDWWGPLEKNSDLICNLYLYLQNLSFQFEICSKFCFNRAGQGVGTWSFYTAFNKSVTIVFNRSVFLPWNLSRRKNQKDEKPLRS